MQRNILLAFLFASLPMMADDWMARIDDYVYITQVSIPGTHDSATGHGFTGFLGVLFGESMGRTQDKTIAEQWEAGVRAFDLRPCVDGDELRINHGILSTTLTLADALNTICTLLDEHPTEAAIVIMRHEDDGDGGDTSWSKMVVALLNEDNIKAHSADFKAVLTLGQCRGKMLLFSRDKYATNPVSGGFISGWSHSANYTDQTKGTITAKSISVPCYVQDFYDVSADGATATKSAAITTMLSFYSVRNNNNRLWCINHTSGYTESSSDGYRQNASIQNKVVIDYLTETAGPTGIIMMDYAGTDSSKGIDVHGMELVQAIIDNNFLYGARGNGIESPTVYKRSTAAYYDLSGRRVDNPVSGVYVTAGRKVQY